MGIAGCGLDAAMPKEFADHRQALAPHGCMTGESVALIPSSELAP
jgi:hypothetical protein